jgi:hypothetical protein
MKKCYYLPTWEAKKDVMIDFDEKYIVMSDCKKSLKDIFDTQNSNNQDNLGVIDKIIPSDPILAYLCEITGAEMYGDYIALEENIDWFYAGGIRTLGDIIGFKCDFSPTFFHVVAKHGIYLNREKVTSNPIEYFEGNVFKEYYKFLRGEENKFILFYYSNLIKIDKFKSNDILNGS